MKLSEKEAHLVREARAVRDTIINLAEECALTRQQYHLLRVAGKRLWDVTECYGGELFWQVEAEDEVEGTIHYE